MSCEFLFKGPYLGPQYKLRIFQDTQYRGINFVFERAVLCAQIGHWNHNGGSIRLSNTGPQFRDSVFGVSFCCLVGYVPSCFAARQAQERIRPPHPQGWWTCSRGANANQTLTSGKLNKV